MFFLMVSLLSSTAFAYEKEVDWTQVFWEEDSRRIFEGEYQNELYVRDKRDSYPKEGSTQTLDSCEVKKDITSLAKQRTKDTFYVLKDKKVYGWGECGEGTLINCSSEDDLTFPLVISELSDVDEIQHIWQDVCFHQPEGWSCFSELTYDWFEVFDKNNPLHSGDFNVQQKTFSTDYSVTNHFEWLWSDSFFSVR